MSDVVLKEKCVSCTLDLTEACNLACDYCFTYSKHKKRVMTPEMGKRILDWWMPQTVDRGVNVSWWGGEPLLEWNLLKELNAYAQQKADELGKDIAFGGTTNGVLFTPDKVEWCAKNKNMLLVSIDGIKAAHDMHRKFPDGRGSWDIIIKNIKEALKIYPGLKLRSSISANNAQYFFETVQYFFDEIGIEDFAFSPVLESSWDEKAFDIMREQFSLATDYMIKRMLEGKKTVLKHLNDEALCGKHDPQTPCGAVNRYIAWSVDGYAFPCHRFNKHGLTTEERSKLPTLIGRPVGDSFEWLNKEYREQFDFKNNPPEHCLKCDIFETSNCNGGCYASNHDFGGSCRSKIDTQCQWQRILYDTGKELAEKAKENQLSLYDSNGTAGGSDSDKLTGCVCFNMCYSEGTDNEIMHIDKRYELGCLCYQTSYMGDPNPQFRTLDQIIQDKELKSRFTALSKRILESADEEKDEQQKALEKQILEKTIKMLS